MARGRNIKPGFFTNDELVELPFSARLLFIGLWTIADREGRLIDRPKKIKMEIFPADDIDCDADLAKLASSGFINRYEADDIKVISIENFCKHQAPHTTEKDSVLPDVAGYYTVNERSPKGVITGKPRFLTKEELAVNVKPTLSHVNPPNNNALIPDSSFLIPDSLILNPEPLKKPKTNVPPSGETAEVFEYWRQVMQHPQAKLDAKRSKAIAGRLKDGYTVGDLCQAVDGCKYDPWSQGANDRKAIFDDIELICRDGTKVDRFIAIAQRGPVSNRTSNAQQTIDNLQRYLEENP